MRVLVCGGRGFKRYDIVKKVLSTLDITEICSGHAQGADEDAERYAAEFRIPITVFPAHWNTYKRSAGAIRNRLMLTEFEPDTVVAFPGGRGTDDMTRLARLDPHVHTLIVSDEFGNIRTEDVAPQPMLVLEWP
jgi:hypothetical protein